MNAFKDARVLPSLMRKNTDGAKRPVIDQRKHKLVSPFYKAGIFWVWGLPEMKMMHPPFRQKAVYIEKRGMTGAKVRMEVCANGNLVFKRLPSSFAFDRTLEIVGGLDLPGHAANPPVC
jgi:hypothetical protein